MKAVASEEEGLRNAGKAVHEMARDFGAKYGIEHKQDLLAMVAIQCMAEKLKWEAASAEWQQAVAQRLTTLEHLLPAAT